LAEPAEQVVAEMVELITARLPLVLQTRVLVAVVVEILLMVSPAVLAL
jgi:hypothetical protein